MSRAGRKPQWAGRCRCPKCRHDVSRVQASCAQEDGMFVRIRICAQCDHHWWTAQEPEYVVPESQRTYRKGKPALAQAQENSPAE